MSYRRAIILARNSSSAVWYPHTTGWYSYRSQHGISISADAPIGTGIETENAVGRYSYRSTHKTLPSRLIPIDTSVGNNIESEISMEELHALATQKCTPVSLTDMYKYASANAGSKNYLPQRLRNAQFLHRELQIRIAQRAMDLLTLPHGLNKTTHVQEITHIYLKYLRILKSFPCPSNNQEELEFTDMLQEMFLDRSTIPMALARGVAYLNDNRKEELDIERLQEMENALNRFFTAHVGLRLLTEHHILCDVTRQIGNKGLRSRQSCLQNSPLDRQKEDIFLGCIKGHCDPAVEARFVATQVVSHYRDRYGASPEIEIIDCTPEKFADTDFTFVPHHLHFMLEQVLKNSCLSVIKRYKKDDRTENHSVLKMAPLPSIRVVIAKGAEDITIKIADKGGGVARSVIDKMWNFSHSTQNDEVRSMEKNATFESDGFIGSNTRGFGLPLSRIYARYFGGELILKSMEGYGVNAYLYLPVLGVTCENLPKRVLLSPGNTDSIYNEKQFNSDTSYDTSIGGNEQRQGSGRYLLSCLTQLKTRDAL